MSKLELYREDFYTTEESAADGQKLDLSRSIRLDGGIPDFGLFPLTNEMCYYADSWYVVDDNISTPMHFSSLDDLAEHLQSLANLDYSYLEEGGPAPHEDCVYVRVPLSQEEREEVEKQLPMNLYADKQVDLL